MSSSFGSFAWSEQCSSSAIQDSSTNGAFFLGNEAICFFPEVLIGGAITVAVAAYFLQTPKKVYNALITIFRLDLTETQKKNVMNQLETLYETVKDSNGKTIYDSDLTGVKNYLLKQNIKSYDDLISQLKILNSQKRKGTLKSFLASKNVGSGQEAEKVVVGAVEEVAQTSEIISDF